MAPSPPGNGEMAQYLVELLITLEIQNGRLYDIARLHLMAAEYSWQNFTPFFDAGAFCTMCTPGKILPHFFMQELFVR